MIKVIPKYYTVKVVQAKASDIAVDEVFSDNGNTYRVMSLRNAGDLVAFTVMDLEDGSISRIWTLSDTELPVHVKIQRV